MMFARNRIIAAVLCGMGWMGFAGTDAANASVITLIDGNSTAQFETAVGQANPAGQFNWNIDGYNALARQWFWYRKTNSSFAAGSAPEKALDTLSATPGITTADLDATGDDNYLMLDYQGTGLRVRVVYTLKGGAPGSGQSGLNEIIRLTNTGSTTHYLSFYQYVDINLFSPNAGPDTLQIVNGNTAVQSNPTSSVSEVVTTPSPTYYMAGLTPNVLNLLTDSDGDNLNPSFTGPVVGDVSWAFQWNLTIAPGNTVFISKLKSIDLRSPSNNVPEPATLALLGAGLILIVQRRGRGAQNYRAS